MKNPNKYILSFLTWIMFSAVQAQTVKIPDSFVTGTDIIIRVDQVSPQTRFIRVTKDEHEQININIRDLDRGVEGKKETYSGKILAGQFNVPGLHHLSVETVSEAGTAQVQFNKHIYVSTAGQAQLIFPNPPPSLLDPPASQITLTRSIKDTLAAIADIFSKVYNRILYDTALIKKNNDTIHYNIDSFYVYLDNVADIMALEIDSGKLIEVTYWIDIKNGMTLINWMDDTTSYVQRIHPDPNLVDEYSLTRDALRWIFARWRRDLLITDEQNLFKKWEYWLLNAPPDNNPADKLRYFPRPDNYITSILLTYFFPGHKKRNSTIRLVFPDDYYKHILFLIKLTGTKKK